MIKKKLYWLKVRELWRRQWHPTLVLLPGKSHGWRSLVGYSPWGCKKLGMTEWIAISFDIFYRIPEKSILYAHWLPWWLRW